MMALSLKAGEGVGTVNVVNLDDNLQPDAPWPSEISAPEVVLNGKLRVMLNADGHSAPSQWYVAIGRPSLRRREPEGRPVKAH